MTKKKDKDGSRYAQVCLWRRDIKKKDGPEVYISLPISICFLLAQEACIRIRMTDPLDYVINKSRFIPKTLYDCGV
jgi:hypothetical protein